MPEIREKPGRQHEIGKLLVPVRIGGPVEHGIRLRDRRHDAATCLDEAGKLVRRFLAVAEDDHHRAQLLRRDVARENHRHGVTGLVLRQWTRQRRAAADSTDEMGEIRHGAFRYCGMCHQRRSRQ